MDENVTPSNIGGMGPISLPTMSGELGSGDVPAGEGDAKEENKKKKKMLHTKFESFINENLRPDELEYLAKEIANHKQWDNWEPTDKEVMDVIKKDKPFGKPLLKNATSSQKKEAVKIIQDYLAESVDEAAPLLKQAKLSSAEYQKAKKLKGFNLDDYKWDSKQQLYIKESVNEDFVFVKESFSDFINEGIKLRKWDYTGTMNVGSDKYIYFQDGDNVFYVAVTDDEYSDYTEGGTLKKRLVNNLAKSGKAISREEYDKKNPAKGFSKYLNQGGRVWDHNEINESIYDSNIDSIFKELEADDKLEYLFNQIGVQSYIMRGGLPQSKPGDIGSRTSILIANPPSKRELYIIPKGKPGQYELYDDKGYDRGKEIISGDSKKILSTLQKNINILESVDEGTFQGNEIAIYGGEDGETYIEKRGKGYYGYNNSFDFEAKNKKELEQKLKSWGYYLVAGSLDEATMQRYSWVKVKKGEHKGEEGRIMVYGGPRKHSVVALDYGEYNINPKDLELVDESVDEAKAHDARTDLGYVAFLREMADWLNSRDLQEAYDNAIDVLQDKGMSEKQAIGFLNSPHGKYMGEYLVPGRDFGHEAFLDKLEEYYNERMLRKFAKDYVKLANIAEAIAEGFFSRLKGKETSKEEKEIDKMIDQIQDTDVSGLFDDALNNLDTLDKVMAAIEEADPEDVDDAFKEYRKKTKNYKKFLGVLKGNHQTLKKQYGKEAIDDLGLKSKNMMDQFTKMSNDIARSQR